MQTPLPPSASVLSLRSRMPEPLKSASAPVSADLRRVGPADIRLLARVDDDIFDEPIDPARLATYLAQPQNLSLIHI